MNFLNILSYFLGHFCPPGPGSSWPKSGSSTLILSPGAGIWRKWWWLVQGSDGCDDVGVQTTGEAFRRQKKNIQHFKIWIFLNFWVIFWVILPFWIRIQPTKIIADPDPPHWSCPLVQGSDGCDEGEHVGAVGDSYPVFRIRIGFNADPDPVFLSKRTTHCNLFIPRPSYGRSLPPSKKNI